MCQIRRFYMKFYDNDILAKVLHTYIVNLKMHIWLIYVTILSIRIRERLWSNY